MQRDLLIRPDSFPGTVTGTFSFGPEAVGFDYLGFEIRRVSSGQNWSGKTGENELGLVLLGGRCSVSSTEGSWSHLGERSDVFSGMPTSLYLPPQTEFTVSGETDCEMACCSCRAEEKFPARLIRPDDVEVEIRGGGNATRQINHIIKPDFLAQRLLIVEVYTPSGNWSSYPLTSTTCINLHRKWISRRFTITRSIVPKATQFNESTPKIADSTQH